MNLVETWQTLWLIAGPWGQAIIAFTAGAMVGSFVNVCAIRIPEKRNIWVGQSSCPNCGHVIRPWHNWPIIGWLMLRGRCYDCKTPISPRYFLVEVLNGLLWMGIARGMGATWPALTMACLYSVGVAVLLIHWQKPKNKI